MRGPRFFKKKVFLDDLFSRSSSGNTTNHWIQTTIKAFAVIGTNNSGFKLELVPDPAQGHVEGLPLYDGFYHNFSTIPDQAVLENKVSQPGVWVEFLFSTEDTLNLGTIRTASGTSTHITEGTNYSMVKATINGVVSELIPANDLRSVAILQHKSGGSVWIGKPAQLADGDYQNICYEIKPGENFIWKNASSLNAKSTGADTVFSLTQEMK